MKLLTTLFLCLSLSGAIAQTKKPATKVAAKPAVAATKTPGQLIYEQNCLTCHQATGSGVPNLNPPLRGTDWVLGDKTRLINVLLKGLEGQEIEGDMYDNAMPAHDFLNDTQIADVLTYIRSNFGNKADAVTADEVKALRGK
ncbi:c-type cytochrome [Spirosoma fluviale]|uniref:Cytochrome c, mono- and diheme variants n=1 Tax=Spirosoma fluviale TaxID=1597977 RepID=A0A286GHN2_9BACT|nr:cytochrome c [Spirosoma fluviale]SOD94992.1 Cytochrome c, mono- and diheme variants [Spirosoma fluviale]